MILCLWPPLGNHSGRRRRLRSRSRDRSCSRDRRRRSRSRSRDRRRRSWSRSRDQRRRSRSRSGDRRRRSRSGDHRTSKRHHHHRRRYDTSGLTGGNCMSLMQKFHILNHQERRNFLSWIIYIRNQKLHHVLLLLLLLMSHKLGRSLVSAQYWEGRGGTLHYV